MRALLLVTYLNWIAWFPFLLFDTNWMGTEVYGGKVGKGQSYDMGVHAGTLGLMLNLVVRGAVSLGIDFLVRKLGGVKLLWGASNFILTIYLALTVLITKLSEAQRRIAASVPVAV